MTALSYVTSKVSGILALLKRSLSGQKKKSANRNNKPIEATTAYDPTIVDRSQRIPLIIKSMYRSGTLLDVGCGGIQQTTFDLVSATGDYESIVGIDAFNKSIEERKAWAAQRTDAERFTFLNGEIQKMQFNRKFDVILLSHVMEHLTEAEAESTLNYLWSICDRQMIVETPNEFEDGRNAVTQFSNPYQKHKSLVDNAFMARHLFTKIFTYVQESGFSNSIYVRNRSI